MQPAESAGSRAGHWVSGIARDLLGADQVGAPHCAASRDAHRAHNAAALIAMPPRRDARTSKRRPPKQNAPINQHQSEVSRAMPYWVSLLLPSLRPTRHCSAAQSRGSLSAAAAAAADGMRARDAEGERERERERGGGRERCSTCVAVAASVGVRVDRRRGRAVGEFGSERQRGSERENNGADCSSLARDGEPFVVLCVISARRTCARASRLSPSRDGDTIILANNRPPLSLL